MIPLEMGSDQHLPRQLSGAPDPPRGRGALSNPSSRFEKLHVEPDPEDGSEPSPARRTEFYRDTSETLINYNDSPDIGFEASMNPYRGCEHGCIYCYARPTHEYLGFSAGLDFETRIMVKDRAPQLLRAELSSPRWKPQVIALSGVTDPYQPVERKLRITRGCLEVLAEFRNPVGIVTKNHLVTRDIDLLSVLARSAAAMVYISVTTLDQELASRMEPRTSQPQHRLDAMARLADAGIPVGVMVAPVVPGLTDHEMPAILAAAAAAGARSAGYVVLRLPHGLSSLFPEWLQAHYPLRSEKVLSQIRSVREGKLNSAEFGTRFQGKGTLADQIAQIFRVSCQRHGIQARSPSLSVADFRRPGGQQLDLFR